MNRPAESPAVTRARREALLVFGVWLAACAYSLSVCFRFGYARDAATLTYVVGFPDWIFWGIVAPWCVCTAISFVMAYVVIADEDLGEEQAEQKLGGAVEEAEHV